MTVFIFMKHAWDAEMVLSVPVIHERASQIKGGFHLLIGP